MPSLARIGLRDVTRWVLILPLVLVGLMTTPARATANAWQNASSSVALSNCFGGSGNVRSEVGWWTSVGANGLPNGAFPRTGSLFFAHVVVSVNGNPCAGGVASVVELQLPTGVALAVSGAQPVHCFLTTPLGTTDVTGAPSAACPRDPRRGTASTLDIALGTRAVPSYSSLAIEVPVRAMAPLDGLSGGSTLEASSRTDWGVATPSLRIWVPLAAVTISYPAPAATSITPTSAHLAGRVASHGTNGPASIDLGPTTAYGQSKHAYDVSGTADAYDVWEDFAGLRPGTRYHWRLRYETGGTSFAGADQTFTTPIPADRIAPRLTALSISPARFSAGKLVSIRVRASEPVTLVFSVQRAAAHGRWSTVRGSFTATGQSGANRLRFTGRIGGRLLAPGRYRLVAIARDRAANRSAIARAGFTIAAAASRRAGPRSG